MFACDTNKLHAPPQLPGSVNQRLAKKLALSGASAPQPKREPKPKASALALARARAKALQLSLWPAKALELGQSKS